MSIVIKGKRKKAKVRFPDMPNDSPCFYCDFSHLGECWVREGWDAPCPVEDLPDKHGRLIDAAALTTAVLKAMNSKEDISVIGLIDKAPTIIEAEDRE